MGSRKGGPSSRRKPISAQATLSDRRMDAAICGRGGRCWGRGSDPVKARPDNSAMPADLTDDDKAIIVELLRDTIAIDRFPLQRGNCERRPMRRKRPNGLWNRPGRMLSATR